MIKCIIAGSRTFNDYALLKKILAGFFSTMDPKDVEIVSGTARGADQLGERYAKEHSLTVQRFHAEWNRYGRSAGYRRNEVMAQYATHLIAFWDGESRGTKHMIDLAKKANLSVYVVKT